MSCPKTLKINNKSFCARVTLRLSCHTQETFTSPIRFHGMAVFEDIVEVLCILSVNEFCSKVIGNNIEGDGATGITAE